MEPLVIDVWADVSCPWCFIGHRRLALALFDEPPGSVVVQRRAFELAPDLPPGGTDLAALERKLGGPEAMKQAFEVVTREGEDAGIAFRFDRMAGSPNTRLAHRLVKLADSAELGQQVLDGLFRAHFTDGVDIGDVDAAVEVASRCGLNPVALRAALDEGAGELEVEGDEGLAARIGISGVPFFLAAASVGLSGAHPPATYRELVAAGRQRAAAAAPDG